MANTIQIKVKTTTGAPTAGQLASGELCFVDPDNDLYIKKQDNSIELLNPAGGGGGEPSENVIFTATKTSGQNINGTEGTETDLTWDVVSQDTGQITGFSSGNSQVTFTNAGWVNVHCSAYISNGLVNNRSMYSVSIYHYNSSDVLQYSYHGDMQYNRDDNNAYDSSGGSVSQNMLRVSAGDYIIIRTRVFDDGSSTTNQPLDTTYSKLRIAKIVF